MNNGECFDDVIIFLKNTIEPLVRDHEPWRAVSLLRSDEIVDVLDNIERIECEDFMLPYVNDLKYQIEEDIRCNFIDINKYVDAVNDYEDYTEICTNFMFGESNTVLAAIYNDLTKWKSDIIDTVIEPRLPVYKHLINKKNLPF